MASALIDTNLFVLLVVGMTNKKYIRTHKRTREYLVEDYDKLFDLLKNYNSLWVTSHCLAETSNLLKQTHHSQKEELLKMLSAICHRFSESHIHKEHIFANGEYVRLGVADTGFIQKSKRVTCSFTVDHDLYLTISRLGRNVVNFNHFRTYLYP